MTSRVLSKTEKALIAQVKREGGDSEAAKILKLYRAIAESTGGVSSALWYSLVHCSWGDRGEKYFFFHKGIEKLLTTIKL